MHVHPSDLNMNSLEDDFHDLLTQDAPDEAGATLATTVEPILQRLAVANNPESMLVLCSIDGVLVEPEPEAHLAAHIDAIRDVFGVDVPLEDFWDVAEHGMTDRRIAQLLAQRGDPRSLDASAEEVERWRQRIGELFEAYTVFGGLKPTLLSRVQHGLDRMRSAHGVQVTLASGNVERIARCKLSETGIADYFPEGEGGFGDFELERHELVRHALQRAGWWDESRNALPANWAARVFLLGDTVRDMEAAQQAGIRSVGIATGGQGTRELKAAGAECVFLRFDRAVEWVLAQRNSGGPSRMTGQA